MDAYETIQLLRYYRHDLMNDLQIIHGYLSMDNMAKVKSKVSECIDNYEEERKLISLHAPEFIVWLLTSIYKTNDINVSYTVVNEGLNLEGLQSMLIKDGEQLISTIQTERDPATIVNVHLLIDGDKQSSTLQLTYTINGIFNDLNLFLDNLQHVSEYETERMETAANQVVYQCTYPMS